MKNPRNTIPPMTPIYTLLRCHVSLRISGMIANTVSSVPKAM
jgi:hypothetical protein